MITVLNIQPKPFVRFGELHTPIEKTNTYNAEIAKNESIRLYGEYRNTGREPIPFDRTFKIGDTCEYHSYNFTYTGTIIAIGAKTIKIHKGNYPAGSNVVLDLYEFAWRNWNFDAERIKAENTQVSYFI